VKTAIVTSALMIGLTPVTAQAGDLWTSFRACLSDALTAETMTLPLAKPAPGQTTLSVRCRGASATRLFETMAAVGKSGSASGVETRAAEAVQCFRFAGPPASYECMVTIGVGAPFVGGL
jgi:hypothetical protein